MASKTIQITKNDNKLTTDKGILVKIFERTVENDGYKVKEIASEKKKPISSIATLIKP